MNVESIFLQRFLDWREEAEPLVKNVCVDSSCGCVLSWLLREVPFSTAALLQPDVSRPRRTTGMLQHGMLGTVVHPQTLSSYHPNKFLHVVSIFKEKVPPSLFFYESGFYGRGGGGGVAAFQMSFLFSKFRVHQTTNLFIKRL